MNSSTIFSWPNACLILLIALAVMDYTRRTGPINDFFGRTRRGGPFGTLLVLVMAVLAFMYLPIGDHWVGSVFAPRPPVVVPDDPRGRSYGYLPGEPEIVPEPLSPEETTPDDDLQDFHQFRQDVPVSPKQPLRPYSREEQAVPSEKFRAAERVKGHPVGPNIFYIIPDWAGSNPTKALSRLRGSPQYHTQFKIAGKPLQQVGYGRFSNWEEGEAFRLNLGLDRSPRAFRWVE